MPTHPANLTRCHPNHERIRFDTSIHDRPRANKGELANTNTAHDGAVRPQGSPPMNNGFFVLTLPANLTAGIGYVRKHYAGAAEDIVLQNHCVINANAVLNLYVVSNHGVITDKYVLPKRTVTSDPRTGADMHPVPNASSITDGRTIINDRGRVDS